MRKYEGYEKAEAFTGEYERLEVGGYVCRILQVKAEENDGTKNYDTLLKIGFDIAEGEHKDYYKRQFDRKKQNNADAKWPGMYYQTIKQSDLKYFKGFITAIEESNSGFKWDWDEQKLKNKLFGGVFAEEEYERSDGKVYTSVKCRFVRSVGAIRDGKFTVPEKKLLSGSTLHKGVIGQAADSGFAPMDDDDELPF